MCQREADGPYCFRVTMPSNDIVFNRTVSLHLVRLNQKSVMYVVDRVTKFNAACFLNGDLTLQVRHAFLCILVTAYVEFPVILALDQGPQICSDEWCSQAQRFGMFFTSFLSRKSQ